MELTKEARKALINAAPHEGARVDGALAELLGHGLVTRAGNLTRKGTIVRQRVLDEMLEAL